MNRPLQKLLVRAATSQRLAAGRQCLAGWRRQMSGRDPLADVFVDPDDPYCALLLSFLPALADYCGIRLRYWLVPATKPRFRPQTDWLDDYAVRDCRAMARELGVAFLDRDRAPPAGLRDALRRAMAAAAHSGSFSDTVVQGTLAYWCGDVATIDRLCSGQRAGNADLDRLQRAGAQRRGALGHYDSAMVYFEGGWYRGVDRLPRLLARVAPTPASLPPSLQPLRALDELALPAEPRGQATGDGGALQLFWSFRSPYSWIVLPRAEDIASAFGLRLEPRPVLPMVSRGLPLPRLKARCLLADAAREAARHGVPLRCFGDPLGAGVERSFALWALAESAGRALPFLYSAGRAIWVEGRNLSRDRGLRFVAERAGLDWTVAREALHDERWRGLAERNRRDLQEAGIWGVPAFRMADLALWGQDRCWLLTRQLSRRATEKNGSWK